MSGNEGFLKKFGPWEFKTPQRQMHLHYSLKKDPTLRFVAEDNPNIVGHGIRRCDPCSLQSTNVARVQVVILSVARNPGATSTKIVNSAVTFQTFPTNSLCSMKFELVV